MYDIYVLPYEHDIILDTFNPNDSQKKTVVEIDNTSKITERKA